MTVITNTKTKTKTSQFLQNTTDLLKKDLTEATRINKYLESELNMAKDHIQALKGKKRLYHLSLFWSLLIIVKVSSYINSFLI